MQLKRALGALLVMAGVAAASPAGATLLTYTANLTASQVVDGGGSTSLATGTALVTLDDTLFTVTTDVTWSGLSGPADRAHLHFAPLGVSRSVADPDTFFFHEVLDDPARTILNCDLAFVDCVPASGSSTDVLQLAIDDGYGAGLALGFATDAFADLILALNQGDIYIDMHTALSPSGEIRGQLAASSTVPEPSTLALAALGVAGALLSRRVKRGKLSRLSLQ
jgi:hypothetical protein